MTPRNQKRILYIVGGFSIGGTERHLSLILPKMANAGYCIHVCALAADGPMSAPIRAAGIPIEFITPRFSLRIPKLQGAIELLSRAFQVAKLVKKIRPDVVHCFLSEPSVIGWISSLITGWRHTLVISKRNQAARPSAFPGDKLLERFALRSADQVLGHSTIVVEELIEQGVDKSRLWLIHNGIALEPITESIRTNERLKYKLSEKTIVFVSVANLIPYKGHELLLRALERFNREVQQDWCLFLVGGDVNSVYGRYLQELAQSIGLSDKAIFVGQIENPIPLLAAADVGILVSQHEGFSNALVEFMACGLPVIATSVGGNTDAVLHGATGWLIPHDNESALIQSLIASTDPKVRKAFGSAGQQRYQAEFTLDRCVDTYLNFYQSLSKEAGLSISE